MAQAWRDAVFRIDSEAQASHAFGSGFVCHREGNRTYLLTCNHVIEAIGEAQARIRQLPVEVVARGDDTLDLSLIVVAGLTDSPVLSLSDAGESGQPFVVYGYTWADPSDKKSGKSLARPLEGQLGADTVFSSDQRPKVPAWDLPFDENDQFAELLDGYSGSPVWDPHNESVIAVVSHRRGKKMGYAIAVSNLLQIYPRAEAFLRSNVSTSLSDQSRPTFPSDAIQNQIPLKPPPDSEFKAAIRKALIDLFSYKNLSGAAEILLGYPKKVEPTQAADLLLKLKPLKAVERWTDVVTVLYDKTSVIGEAQRDVWSLLESVHLYLLPRLVDLTQLVNDTRFPKDALLFTIAAHHEPPNRPVELLFARINRNRIVQFEQGGQKLAQERAVPTTAVDVSDRDWRDRSDPDIESAVEQLGFELMKRFYMPPPEQMKERNWKKLNNRLKAGRHGKLGFYLVIPHADLYADPVVLSRLYCYLPNLPKFFMTGEVGEHLPFVCDPDEIDAVIEVFWDLKLRWCGRARQQTASTHDETRFDESILID